MRFIAFNIITISFRGREDIVMSTAAFIAKEQVVGFSTEYLSL